MRIDFISSSLVGGGAERVLVNIANHLTNKGYIISIITFNEGDDYEISNEISRIRLHKGKFRNHKLRSTLNLIKHYKERKNRPDIIISFITEINLISILVSKIYSLKIICSEHINYLQKGNYVTKFTRNFIYRFADIITVLTSFDKPYYEKKGCQVFVMPNPCSFHSLNKLNTNRKKIILAIGNLNRYHHKGFDNLIKLSVPILNKNKDWILKIIGGGEKGRETLIKSVSENKMEEKIIFTGFRNDVHELMQESSIFILPSRFEGLPMVLLESMSQGMACIAFDCKTGPSDIIKHSENGFLIKDQDMTAMQNGLSLLINDSKLRRELGKKAISSLDKYSIENVGQLWEELIKRILVPE
jgi:GalNAc-alpha-(1->4)-GalNAc-alpha-(1->3)-diNAcBac-PP-undecaprenol alpha-1,4-N-acetyl-D-galactosaminyltransferase